MGPLNYDHKKTNDKINYDYIKRLSLYIKKTYLNAENASVKPEE